MIKISGFYYDGKSSDQIQVIVEFYESGEVLIEGDNLTLKTSLDHLKIAPRLANTRRNIYLSGGAKLETDDNISVDNICTYFDKNIINTFIYKLEKNWSYALIALVSTILFVWGSIEYGVPVAAKWAAKGVPVKYELNIGEQGLEALDEWLFAPSTISQNDQERLQKYFKSLTITSKQEYPYQLVLRSSQKMGANALALPGGFIILTDALFDLAENDEQIFSVLAHEMGHIEFQHGLRSIFQNSITALFMAGVLGDITSVTSLSVALPTILVETRYSREFELEADKYAVQILQERSRDVKEYIRILKLLEQQSSSDDEFDYLSSHPAMGKRIDIIQDLEKLY